MSKTVLIIITSVLCLTNVFGQGYLNFPVKTQFFEVEGSTFLTAIQLDGKTFISELSETGAVVWTDSISFPSGDDFILLNTVERFGTTNNYLMVSQRSLNGELVNFYDTTLYLFSIVSLDDQSIVDTSSIEISSYTLYCTSKNDSTMLLFSKLNPSGTPGYETISISHSLDTTQVATFDSIPFYGYTGHSFYSSDANFYYYYTYLYDGIIGHSEYSENVTSLGYNSYNCYSSLNFNEVSYRTDFQDSVFFFNQSIGNGSNGLKRQWAFAWLDNDLNMLSETQFFTPNTNLPPVSGFGYYHYNTDDNRIVVTDQYIYVMGYLSSIGDSLTIFIYDYNFTEVCKIPLNTSVSGDQQLIKINNRAYYQVANGTENYDFYELNGCDFASTFLNESVIFELLIYPNPTKDIFYIQNREQAELYISVLDIKGSELFHVKSEDDLIEINLGNYKPSIYILDIRSSKGRSKQRIVKQ